MIQNKHIIKSLPLLAAALGKKYGVEVLIGGNNACTNGKTIYLPTLPQDCSDTLLGLVRGYIDHESAHLRETDFEVLQTGKLTPLEKHIWNILEDWRVEHKLAAVFPGCRQNLTWLIKHIFLNSAEENNSKVEAVSIVEWLLLSVRAWDVPELEPVCVSLAKRIEPVFPGLLAELSSILQAVPAKCKSSQDCLSVARDIVQALAKYVGQYEESQKVGAANSQRVMTSREGKKAQSKNKPANPLQQLKKLMNSLADELPQGIGARTAQKLGECQEVQHTKRRDGIVVATLGHKELTALDEQARVKAKAATKALRTRLQGLLQSSQLVRGQNGYRGKLNTRKLHQVSIGEAKIFLTKTMRQGLDTAIHILLDSSGSMSNQQMELACAACYAVANALHTVPGINLAVTAFPGRPISDDQVNTVVPILKHGQKLHNKFSLTACGSTPMDSAIWWALQQTMFLSESRKIILIISDGEPYSFTATQKAINTAQSIGHEVYGIGIDCDGMQRLLPENSKIIRSIQELAPAMFGMLQKTLLGKVKGA